MAVHIKLIKNNIKSSSSYGKYFAKTVSQGEVTLDEIAAEACRNSGFGEGAVIGVVTELQGIQGRHILYDFCEGVKAVWQTGFKP